MELKKTDELFVRCPRCGGLHKKIDDLFKCTCNTIFCAYFHDGDVPYCPNCGEQQNINLQLDEIIDLNLVTNEYYTKLMDLGENNAFNCQNIAFNLLDGFDFDWEYTNQKISLYQFLLDLVNSTNLSSDGGTSCLINCNSISTSKLAIEIINKLNGQNNVKIVEIKNNVFANIDTIRSTIESVKYNGPKQAIYILNLVENQFELTHINKFYGFLDKDFLNRNTRGDVLLIIYSEASPVKFDIHFNSRIERSINTGSFEEFITKKSLGFDVDELDRETEDANRRKKNEKT